MSYQKDRVPVIEEHNICKLVNGFQWEKYKRKFMFSFIFAAIQAKRENINNLKFKMKVSCLEE